MTEKVKPVPVREILVDAIEKINEVFQYVSIKKDHKTVAEVIASLPTLIKAAPDFNTFPKEWFAHLERLADEAQYMIDSGKSDNALSLLHSVGAIVGDRNNIEKVLHIVYGGK